MNLNEVLAELKSLGTDKNKKVYAKEGVKRETFGVGFNHLEKMKKKIKTNHELAVRLWQTNILEAMMLATMIADPAMIDTKLLKKWAKDLTNYFLADSFAKLVAQTNNAVEFTEQWIRSSNEWLSRAGWSIMEMIAIHNKNLTNDYFEKSLIFLEENVHSCKNKTISAMNSALVAIGLRNKGLREKASATAKRIVKSDEVNNLKQVINLDIIDNIDKGWEAKE